MKYYIVNSFTEKTFSGNPAKVFLAEQDLDQQTMQNIAAESDLTETTFVFRNGNDFDLRWFTPKTEIDLCGHGTMAGAFVISNFLDKGRKEMTFHTRSGEVSVTVKKNLMDMQDLYEMDFPAWEMNPAEITERMTQAAGSMQILEAHTARDLLLLVHSKDEVEDFIPDFDALSAFSEYRGIIVTAKGDNRFDFVSRFFAPNLGITEDAVTGSAHSELIPFWSKRLNKKVMTAQHMSAQGGVLFCEYQGERVKIAGKAVLDTEGEIIL